MPRIRFIGALSVAVVLIGGAMWFRFFQTSPSQAQGVLAPEIGTFSSSSEDIVSADFFNTGASLPRTSTTTLVQADSIGRQLFSDYLALKSQGKTTSSDIQALAERYAENIKNLDLSMPKVNLNQLTILPDSAENLTAYSDTITNIRDKYKNLVAAESQSNESGIKDIRSQAFSTFTGTVSKLYQAAADELLLVRVPASLSANHLELINNYLASAAAMKLLSNTSEDPIRAYAALNIYAQDTNKESELLSNIRTTLMANGIILKNGI